MKIKQGSETLLCADLGRSRRLFILLLIKNKLQNSVSVNFYTSRISSWEMLFFKFDINNLLPKRLFVALSRKNCPSLV